MKKSLIIFIQYAGNVFVQLTTSITVSKCGMANGGSDSSFLELALINPDLYYFVATREEDPNFQA